MPAFNNLLSALVIAGCAIAAPAAKATLVFSTNFDTVAVAPGTFTFVNSVEGWTATVGTIELQNNVAGTPFSQPNLVELDSNQNSAMARTVATSGPSLLTFEYSPRPGVPASSAGIEVSLDGIPVFSIAQSGLGNADTVWSCNRFSFRPATRCNSLRSVPPTAWVAISTTSVSRRSRNPRP
jgi:hypothetical protein